MRQVEQAIEQLRRANPVPNSATLATQLPTQLAEAADSQRERNRMNTATTDAQKPTPTRRARGWTVGLTAAIVVLILGLATVFVTTGENPLAGGPSPVEIAETYIDARNDYDLEGAREMLAEDYTTNEAPYGHRGHETLELVFQSWDDWGFELTDVSCEEMSEANRADWVQCDYLWSTEVIRAGGFPPTEANLQLLIQDGLIHRVSETETGSDPWWETFVAFLEEESPDDFAESVYRAVDLLDPEAVQTVSEELPGYLDLYAEWLDTQEG